MREKLQQLQQAMTLATERQSPDVRDRTIDYQLYLAQYQRIYRQTLYFLDVRVDGQQLHKIGVTTRSLFQRIAEVKQDLKQHHIEKPTYFDLMFQFGTITVIAFLLS
jgi:CRP-like cAMP-binding protein